MTWDEFKVDFIKFIDNSTVNLGRKKTKTRQSFIAAIKSKFDIFISNYEKENQPDCQEDCVEHSTCRDLKKPKTNPMEDRIICIKPNDKNKGLNIGKGVHSMTSSESARADEQLNRSPFTQRTKDKGDVENE